MRIFLITLLFYSQLIINVYLESSQDAGDTKLPSVFIVILVRNKASILPYFLTLFSQIKYPKDRISLWIQNDHNEDESSDILKIWVDAFKSEYHSINITISETPKRFNVAGVAEWPESRYRHIINLREHGLQLARQSWADFIWFLDCDALLTDPHVLYNLIWKDKIVVAPMLLSDTMYSDFWCGMTSSYYYKRTHEYEEILNKQKTGCFPVPMIHTAVLINLRKQVSDQLTFLSENIPDYDGPVDDIIIFAIGANKSGIPLHICNELNYGYTTVPLEEDENLNDEKEKILNLKLHITVDNPPLTIDSLFSEFIHVPSKSKHGFDEIFLINLKRRKERKIRMIYCLDELGINATFVSAIDGKLLTDRDIKELGITLMPGYEDPYYKRSMKKGEIGCFLSHYKIWQKIVKDDLHEVLILEDDLRFEKYFVQKLQVVVKEMHQTSNWDLIYIGRKIMHLKDEHFLEESTIFVYPDYSYWTIGYIISKEGARKLIEAEPLSKMIPIDEFLPIMYDRHPRNDWKAHFANRNLRALSVNPLIVFPMKYTNEVGYVSDTEDSTIAMGKETKEEL